MAFLDVSTGEFLAAEGVELKIICSPSEHYSEIEKFEGIKVSPLSISREINPLNDLISLIKLWILFVKEKPIIVHSQTPKASIISAVASLLAVCEFLVSGIASSLDLEGLLNEKPTLPLSLL